MYSFTPGKTAISPDHFDHLIIKIYSQDGAQA